ncbi:hypothetical protein DF039_34850 [Burkholderia cenocepacia]|nr:hypothetical protein DF039_34850 [Burkholderia cenocepacia]
MESIMSNTATTTASHQRTLANEVRLIKAMPERNFEGEPVALCERDYMHIWVRNDRLELAVDFYAQRVGERPANFDEDQRCAEMLVLSCFGKNRQAFATLYQCGRCLLGGISVEVEGGKLIGRESWLASVAAIERSEVPEATQ